MLPDDEDIVPDVSPGTDQETKFQTRVMMPSVVIRKSNTVEWGNQGNPAGTQKHEDKQRGNCFHSLRAARAVSLRGHSGTDYLMLEPNGDSHWHHEFRSLDKT